MTRMLGAAFAVFAAAAFALPAVAQDARETEKSQTQFDAPASSSSTAATSSGSKRVKELLSDGFEIKTVNVVPRDIVKAGGSTLDVDAVVILLQKGSQMASCYMTYSMFVTGSYFNGNNAACTVFQ